MLTGHFKGRYVNKELVIFESRLLPGICGVFCLTFAFLVATSDAPIEVRFMVSSGGILAAGLTFYRVLVPRWVIHLRDKTLLFQDIGTKRVTEFQVAVITDIRVNLRTTFGAGEGGIGFHKELVLLLADQTVILPLPLMEFSAAKVMDLLKSRILTAPREDK